MNTIIYARVSSREQGDSGLGLEAQLDRCRRECEARGWQAISEVVEVASAGSKRPMLQDALERLDAVGGTLVVSRLDRLARSVMDFAGILDRADKQGWTLVCLSPAVDMSEPYGRMMAQVAMSFAELERALVSMRTREAFERKRADGWAPGFSDPKAISDIVRWRRDGKSYEKIAAMLDLQGVKPPGGKKWDYTTVGRIYRRTTGELIPSERRAGNLR
jgi:DNA invertase Pin-like site-specific DNA recombinase